MYNLNNIYNNLYDLYDFFGNSVSGNTLPADFEETDDAYLLTMDVPGVTKENINVDYTDNILTVHVKKEESEKSDSNKYLRHEVASSYDYTRSFEMKNADSTSIRAKLENGVLAIVAAKVKPVEPEKKYIVIE